MATHSSIPAWKIPRMEEPGRLQSMGSLSRTQLTDFTFTFMHWRRKWQPTPVFLPGESQGWWSLVGCRLWVTQSRIRLKRLSNSSRKIPLNGYTTCLSINQFLAVTNKVLLILVYKSLCGRLFSFFLSENEVFSFP